MDKTETKETQGEMHLRHKLELGKEIDHLRSELQKAKEKEIRGDRMIVDLEHQKCVLKSDLSKAKELNGELVNRSAQQLKEYKAKLKNSAAGRNLTYFEFLELIDQTDSTK